MSEGKKITEMLQKCLNIAAIIDEHNKALIQTVAHLEPSHNAIAALLSGVGFDSETSNEDNLHLLITHHTKLVAENTALRKTLDSHGELIEKIREVANEVAEAGG